MKGQEALLAANIKGYPDPTKRYAILTPNKAVRRMQNSGDDWTLEAKINAPRPEGGTEPLLVLSRPTNTPTPTPKQGLVARVKETIRGSRKPRNR